MVRFFMSLPLAFFAKTSRLFKITKVPFFAGFPSTGRVWGLSRGLVPLRNAKTRWGEPAGLFASSHLAVAVFVEAAS
jgi:hypothetical protein